ncbi:hypothetical protein GUITHDRAFT_119152 [Guillardia theta CCMP2712]|uniref:Uncharacterized protein n=1 Tax=Guillardia theta (strain CCMP2712) TaxID=905079 RepID=L1IEQ6_GUITC|nr:hypothetical protein GUITHDRAFT_119152 [Guillardia theta CCMP2712]EKX34718.1 hypothetical protein GUITHDRAFT_119152 [Guillardia theta CCMP2712]|eukprot:XP_005821698.1 hypothetical protein GUITHDRAFT_119152 [Guillardia theta CCMP2712]
MAAGPWNENHALLALRLRLSALGLILLSFVAYSFPQLIGGKKRHWHALIPGVLGVLFLPCSFGVQKESTRKIAAHVAVLVAVRNFSIMIIIAHALLPLSKLVTCSFYSSSHFFYVFLLRQLVGVFGGINGLFKLMRVAMGEEMDKLDAIYLQAGMSLICTQFLTFAIRWFMENRKKKVQK